MICSNMDVVDKLVNDIDMTTTDKDLLKICLVEDNGEKTEYFQLSIQVHPLMITKESLKSWTLMPIRYVKPLN